MKWGGRISTSGEFSGLPVRIANLLCNSDLYTRRDVVEAFKDRRLPNMHRGLGPKSLKVVLRWMEAAK